MSVDVKFLVFGIIYTPGMFFFIFYSEEELNWFIKMFFFSHIDISLSACFVDMWFV